LIKTNSILAAEQIAMIWNTVTACILDIKRSSGS